MCELHHSRRGPGIGVGLDLLPLACLPFHIGRLGPINTRLELPAGAFAADLTFVVVRSLKLLDARQLA